MIEKTNWIDFDPSDKTPADRQFLLSQLVVPRPIAMVSTIGEDGVLNIAPMSYFLPITGSPMLVGVTMGLREDGEPKHTFLNSSHTGDFVINITTENLSEEIEIVAIESPHSVNEYELASWTPSESEKIKSPGITEARARLEDGGGRVAGFGENRARLRAGFGETFQPLQLGVCTSHGTEIFATVIRLALEAHAGWVCCKLDFCNAFNECSRRAFLRFAAEHHPELLLFLLAAYGAPSYITALGPELLDRRDTMSPPWSPIAPPPSRWKSIQEIRSARDKSYLRWPPHVNLLYPFVVDDGDGLMSYITGKTSYKSGEWYHVVATYDGKLARIYVNGALDVESEAQKGDINYPGNLYFEVGSYHDDNESYPMTGWVSELTLWRKALTEERVRALYEAGVDSHPRSDANSSH